MSEMTTKQYRSAMGLPSVEQTASKVTQEEVKFLLNASKKSASPHKAKRCTSPDGLKFDSKGEMARYYALLQMQQVGIIRDLKRQVKYVFGNKSQTRLVKGENGRKIFYKADFTYEEFDPQTGEWPLVVEDYKGSKRRRDRLYMLKKSLMEYFHWVTIREVYGDE